MGKIIGWILIAGGVLLGLWLGLWVLFVGGIGQIAEGVKATPVNDWWIAFGILRIVLAGWVGWGVGALVVVVGTLFL